MKETYNFKHLFFFCFFLIFSGVLFAQTISNVTYEYSCPCRIEVTYDFNTPAAHDVELYYSTDTTQGWTLATTFKSRTTKTQIVDTWDCEADGKIYGLFYYKLEPICPCRLSNAESVVINGVEWATRNVDAPGTFAVNYRASGMFYLWDSPVGWSSTDPRTSSPAGSLWSTTSSTNATWLSTNDPSPAGFRVPTRTEISTLLNVNAVTKVWINVNGVNGYCFTDCINKNSIFFPAAGDRVYSFGTLAVVGTEGYYWSSTQADGGNAYYLHFSSSGCSSSFFAKPSALPIRPVAK